MKSKAYILAALLAATALSGCATTGVNVTDNQLAFLKPGITTEQEVIAKLGQPTTRMRLADGSVLDSYIYSRSQMKAATFVPVVGLFAGGVDLKSNTVTLQFGPDGKLTTTTSAQSNIDTKTGVTAAK